MSKQSEQQAPAATSVGERIKQRREEKGLSLSRLADAAQVSKSYLHEIENNANVKPSAEVLYNIAEVLDTTVGALLGRRRNPLEQNSADVPLEIPTALEEFARQDRIPEEDKRRLACIKYRDKQPKSVEDWRYLYDTIRRVSTALSDSTEP